jgi:AcrR family transcriptional regulator
MSDTLQADTRTSRKDAERNRHEAILKAAMEVFSDRGFYEADVEEIAALAGVGKGTVFRHFGTKRELFLDTVNWGMEILGERIREATRSVEGARNHVRAALRVYFNFFVEHHKFHRVLMREKSNFREEMERRYSRKYIFDILPLETVIREGVANGDFRDIDPHLSAVALLGMSNVLIYRWLLEGMREPLDDMITVAETIFIEGLQLRK